MKFWFIGVVSRYSNCSTLNRFWASQEFPIFPTEPKIPLIFTTARHLCLSRASSVQSEPPHLISWRSILTLSSHQRLGLASELFPWCFLTNTPHASLFLPYTLHALPLHYSCCNRPINTCRHLYIMKMLIVPIVCVFCCILFCSIMFNSFLLWSTLN